MGTKIRDTYIDILRAIGILSIILVHSDKPYWLGQLNLFNVPLMVFVSGLCSTGPNKKSYYEYVYSRLKRLIIPTWIFIILYLPFLYILYKANVYHGMTFNANNILYSFLLLDKTYGGIGFVWIIRVFLLMMLVTPFVVKMSERIKSDMLYSLIVAAVLCLQISLLKIKGYYGISSIIYDQYLLYVVGYLPFAMGGARLKNMQSNKANRLLVVFLFLFVGVMSIIHYHDKQFWYSIEGKYPPCIQFQLYGLLISTFFWGNKNIFGKLLNFRILTFIGSNTMWIYWWHVPIVLTLNSIITTEFWPVSFILTTVISVSLYFIQYKLVNRSESHFLKKYLIG